MRRVLIYIRNHDVAARDGVSMRQSEARDASHYYRYRERKEEIGYRGRDRDDTAKKIIILPTFVH